MIPTPRDPYVSNRQSGWRSAFPFILFIIVVVGSIGGAVYVKSQRTKKHREDNTFTRTGTLVYKYRGKNMSPHIVMESYGVQYDFMIHVKVWDGLRIGQTITVRWVQYPSVYKYKNRGEVI